MKWTFVHFYYKFTTNIKIMVKSFVTCLLDKQTNFFPPTSLSFSTYINKYIYFTNLMFFTEIYIQIYVFFFKGVCTSLYYVNCVLLLNHLIYLKILGLVDLLQWSRSTCWGERRTNLPETKQNKRKCLHDDDVDEKWPTSYIILHTNTHAHYNNEQ